MRGASSRHTLCVLSGIELHRLFTHTNLYLAQLISRIFLKVHKPTVIGMAPSIISKLDIYHTTV